MNEIGPDTPLRLKKAAEIAFPAGGMTASGLRQEAKRGRLVIERIANKDFTTLRHIEETRKQCRDELKARDCGCNPPEKTATERSSSKPSGSSATVRPNAALDAARAKLNALREGSETISTVSPQITTIGSFDVNKRERAKLRKQRKRIRDRERQASKRAQTGQ